MKEALVLFAKAPRAGQVKTRLIGALTAEQVVDLYIGFLRDTFALMEAVQETRESLSLVLCYTPAEEVEVFEAADLDGCLLLAQRGTQLGERLQHCFADLFELGFQSVVVIGADSPTLPAEILTAAFDHLQSPPRIVSGPTTDGGFYLIGLNHGQATLFAPIDWTVEQTFLQLCQRAAHQGHPIFALPEWYDIDTADDLVRLQEELRAEPDCARYTRRVLRQLFRVS
ncbi:MAG: TIGR04282 family arsenosugar biosynthesis glycosyltransferase [Blastocatellia bacterium]